MKDFYMIAFSSPSLTLPRGIRTQRRAGAKQLFLSHTWRLDEQNRDTHARVKLVRDELMRHGWSIWFDEDEMRGNIDACMAQGIDEADVVIMFLTRRYARAVNAAARGLSSNCNVLKEFEYSLFRGKYILPVVFEEDMKDASRWSPGVLPMRLCMTFYIDGCADASVTSQNIHSFLLGIGKRPNNNPRQSSSHRYGARRMLPRVFAHPRRVRVSAQRLTVDVRL